TAIYTLSLHDALPIWDFEAARAFHAAFGDEHVLDPVPDVLPAAGFDPARRSVLVPVGMGALQARNFDATQDDFVLVVADPLCHRSEEHTSELQSRENL